MGNYLSVDLLGWAAAFFTLIAYSMRTMLPLRVAAICANLFFIAWSWFTWLPPSLALHAALLPFNIWRLVEILRMNRDAQSARGGEFPLAWIAPLLKPVALAQDGYVFRKGDRPDRLYYIDSGKVLLEEIGRELKAGEIFGEIAFFTEGKERTLSARCDGDCRILALDERDFMRLYHQHPAFGLYIVRLVARRLLDGAKTDPAAYVAAADPR